MNFASILILTRSQHNKQPANQFENEQNVEKKVEFGDKVENLNFKSDDYSSMTRHLNFNPWLIVIEIQGLFK